MSDGYFCIRDPAPSLRGKRGMRDRYERKRMKKEREKKKKKKKKKIEGKRERRLKLVEA
jgi:hypothetical protein